MRLLAVLLPVIIIIVLIMGGLAFNRAINRNKEIKDERDQLRREKAHWGKALGEIDTAITGVYTQQADNLIVHDQIQDILLRNGFGPSDRRFHIEQGD